MQNLPLPMRPDRHLVAAKIARPTMSKDRPMGFSPRELRRLVADMIG